MAQMRRIIFLVLLGLAFAPDARADRWLSPQAQQAYSPSRRYLVLVEPAPESTPSATRLSLWDTVGWFRRQRYERRTVNRVSPVKVLVSDQGYVVTLDDWARAGYAHALVIYDPSGHVLRDSRLEELLTSEDLKTCSTKRVLPLVARLVGTSEDLGHSPGCHDNLGRDTHGRRCQRDDQPRPGAIQTPGATCARRPHHIRWRGIRETGRSRAYPVRMASIDISL